MSMIYIDHNGNLVILGDTEPECIFPNKPPMFSIPLKEFEEILNMLKEDYIYQYGSN